MNGQSSHTLNIKHKTQNEDQTKTQHRKKNLDEQYGSHKQKPGVNLDFANDKE